jgi:hypothetical protein
VRTTPAGAAVLLSALLLPSDSPMATRPSRSQAPQTTEYRDPGGRFTFRYPLAFGQPSAGTNDGFGHRVAALRFAGFSSGVRDGRLVLGGEAVLTRGPIRVDLQLLGGLYDAIAAEALPEPLRARVQQALPALSVDTFCAELAKSRHVDLGAPGLDGLPANVRRAIEGVDGMRGRDPVVHVCRTSGDIVTFHKSVPVTDGPGGLRQHFYGALRFLPAPYSSFQLIRGESAAPDPSLLDAMADVVGSLSVGG